jgi:hypothetical protein
MSARLRWERALNRYRFRHPRIATATTAALLGLALLIFAATLPQDPRSVAEGMFFALSLVWVTAAVANPLGWSPIRLRHAVKWLAGYALGAVLLLAMATEHLTRAEIIALAVAQWLLFALVVTYCHRRRFSLRNAFDEI